MDAGAFTDLVLKAGAGALLATLASWGIGRLNNAMTVALSSERQRMANGEDIIALTVKLKKSPPTRVRLDACEVRVTVDGTLRKDLGEALSKSFRHDIRVEGDRGITLVPGDDVQYHASCHVPAGATVHIRVKVKTTQLVLDSVKVATPFWTSSIVVLPEDSSSSPGESP